jgi:uncharacterized membrane protein
MQSSKNKILALIAFGFFTIRLFCFVASPPLTTGWVSYAVGLGMFLGLIITAWLSSTNRALIILLSLIFLAEAAGKFFQTSIFFILGGVLGLLGLVQILSKLIRRNPSA